jgi:SAM-dependent methyltransferase
MPEHTPHPVFARIYAKVAEAGERRGGAEHRRRLLAGLSGRVIEMGAGSGANFSHYPATVSEVVAVEPERYLRERAQRAAAQAPVAVSVLDGVGDRLPGEAGSFDAGVSALVLCTVPHQQAALAELLRVIRPGASCASTSTSSATANVRRAFSGSPTLPSGLMWRAAATWRATRRPGSSKQGFRSRRASDSHSVRRHSFRPTPIFSEQHGALSSTCPRY